MATLSLPAPAVHSAPKSHTFTDAAEQFVQTYDSVYGFRQLLVTARVHHDGAELLARYSFARDLRDAVLRALTANPTDGITEAAYAALVAKVRWQYLADNLADEWTVDCIDQLDTLDAEADAIAYAARADEVADELAFA